MNKPMKRDTEAAVIVERLTAEYDSAVGALKAALKAFMTNGVAPDPVLRAKGAFAYPELRLTYTPSGPPPRLARSYARFSQDRKSTRLNSSHLGISYAVFCLKKKKKHNAHQESVLEITSYGTAPQST